MSGDKTKKGFCYVLLNGRIWRSQKKNIIRNMHWENTVSRLGKTAEIEKWCSNQASGNGIKTRNILRKGNMLRLEKHCFEVCKGQGKGSTNFRANDA